MRRERWRRGSRTGRTAASSSRSRPSAARTRRVSVTFFSWCGWISVEGAAIGLAFRSGEHVWLHGGGGRAFIAQNCVSRGARTRGCTHNKDTHHTKSLCYGARLMQGHRQHTIDRSDLSHSASRERRTRIDRGEPSPTQYGDVATGKRPPEDMLPCRGCSRPRDVDGDRAFFGCATHKASDWIGGQDR